MAKNPTFIVSDESVNRYGYRVLTAGVDTTQFEKNPVMYYMHERFGSGEAKPRVTVIGYWENIRKENGQLLADPVFDEEDEFAANIARKVRKKFLRMASIGFDPKQVSDDKKHLVKGQTRPTVLTSELLEISIVDRGGNNNALKLCNSEGERLNVDETLPKITLNEKSKPEIKMTEIKQINKALNLSEDATVGETLTAINDLKQKEGKLSALEGEIQAAQETEAAELVDKLVEKNIIPEAFKNTQLAAFKNDFAGNKKTALELIDAAKTTADDEDEDEPKANKQLSDFIETKSPMGGKSQNELNAKNEKKTYAWYQQNDPEALAKLQAKEPKKFNQLLTEHLGDDE